MNLCVGGCLRACEASCLGKPFLFIGAQNNFPIQTLYIPIHFSSKEIVRLSASEIDQNRHVKELYSDSSCRKHDTSHSQLFKGEGCNHKAKDFHTRDQSLTQV